jgi:hypothetical protein
MTEEKAAYVPVITFSCKKYEKEIFSVKTTEYDKTVGSTMQKQIYAGSVLHGYKFSHQNANLHFFLVPRPDPMRLHPYPCFGPDRV